MGGIHARASFSYFEKKIPEELNYQRGKSERDASQAEISLISVYFREILSAVIFRYENVSVKSTAENYALSFIKSVYIILLSYESFSSHIHLFKYINYLYISCLYIVILLRYKNYTPIFLNSCIIMNTLI